MNFVQITGFDWLPEQHKGYIFRKCSKIFSETLGEMKLILCIRQLQLVVSLDLKWEKWKLAFFFLSQLSGDIFLQKCLLSNVLYASYEFCPNH